MATFFTPPTVDDGTNILPGYDRENSLWQHFKGRTRGQDVTVVGSTVTLHNGSVSTTVQNAADFVYLGGHRTEISSAEATTLTDAGYDVETV
jgi:hypothetical protein